MTQHKYTFNLETIKSFCDTDHTSQQQQKKYINTSSKKKNLCHIFGVMYQMHHSIMTVNAGLA